MFQVTEISPRSFELRQLFAGTIFFNSFDEIPIFNVTLFNVAGSL
jgi:hypothetical protein